MESMFKKNASVSLPLPHLNNDFRKEKKLKVWNLSQDLACERRQHSNFKPVGFQTRNVLVPYL